MGKNVKSHRKERKGGGGDGNAKRLFFLTPGRVKRKRGWGPKRKEGSMIERWMRYGHISAAFAFGSLSDESIGGCACQFIEYNTRLLLSTSINRIRKKKKKGIKGQGEKGKSGGLHPPVV